MTDTELRDTLAALRTELPTDAEIAAVLRAAEAPRRRRRRRLATGFAVATAAAGALFAALPGADSTTPLPTTATGLLRAAAASAAETKPDPFAGYRYTEVVEHWRWAASGGRPVQEVEQRVENWVDRDWQGRTISQRGRVIQGDERTNDAFVKPRDTPYMYGDGPLATLDIARLPTDPQALRAALIAKYESANWAPGLPTGRQVHYDVVRELLSLLGTANTTPELRAGLWGALALTDGLRKADDVRGGNAVRIPTGYADGNFTIVFDVDTSEMLSWSEVGSGTGTPDQTHTFVRAAQVSSIGDRPSP